MNRVNPEERGWLPVLTALPFLLCAQSAGAYLAKGKLDGVSLDPGTAPGMAEDPSVTATIPTISVNLAAATQILAGGELFGFTGILLALPVAAVIMVLVRHVHDLYKDSDVYMGVEDPDL